MTVKCLDKSLLVWKIEGVDDFTGLIKAIPLKRLKGHSHFISDLALTADGHYAFTSSWDKTLRLWDLNA
jgi:guanine nucleotide-binding protein subunit beta-2-like 1 protein